MGRLFGTDGVRGLANGDLTPELALAVAGAAARVLSARSRRTARAAVVGRDPRASGEMLEAAVVAGLTSAGADVLRVGVLPTPAVAYLTAELRRGLRRRAVRVAQPDARQRHQAVRPRRAQAARRRSRPRSRPRIGEPGPAPTGAGVGRVRDADDAAERYGAHLLGTLPHKLDGLHVVVDCAHGAASAVGPAVLAPGRRRGHRHRGRARRR